MPDNKKGYAPDESVMLTSKSQITLITLHLTCVIPNPLELEDNLISGH